MKTLLIFIFCGCGIPLFGQIVGVDTINYMPRNSTREETIVRETVSKDGKVIRSKTKTKNQYRVDTKVVNKKAYDKALEQSKTIDDCKPCWLRYYNEKGDLLQEGFSYLDCALGKRIEYYPSGKIKAVKYYKSNDTNDWDDFPCSVAEGTWTYYTERGVVEKTETYKDGKPIE